MRLICSTDGFSMAECAGCAVGDPGGGFAVNRRYGEDEEMGGWGRSVGKNGRCEC